MNNNSQQSVLQQKRLTRPFWIFLVIFYSFFPSALLAADEEKLLDAIRQDNREQVQNLLVGGADPNKISISDLMFANPKMLELLFDNDHIKIDINRYCQKLKQELAFYRESMASINKQTPQQILEAKYKNLSAKIDDSPKIPRILHHIWVTNEKTKREISDEDIQYVLDTDKIFSQNGQRWAHIVWTNDKSLIPLSVKKLEANGIMVKEIKEIEKDFKLNKKIEEFIEQGYWGMASDTLRLELIRCVGGVYADLNYDFKRSLEEDIHKYDFFTYSRHEIEVDERIFSAKAHHPILEAAVDLASTRLANYKEFISTSGLSIRDVTYVLTGDPLSVPYFENANKFGTIDVLYSRRICPRESSFETKVLSHRKNRIQNLQETFKIFNKYAGYSCNQDVKELEELIIGSESLILLLRENDKLCPPENLYFGSDRNAFSWISHEKKDNHIAFGASGGT